MKIFVLLALCFVSAGAVSGITADAESAIRNGAIGKYIYRVVDDDGRPVTNASAHVWFSSYGRSQDNANWVVKTDTNGMFIAEHRLNEKFSVGIDKEGYYHTHDEINYLAMLELPVKDGKWQPYGETRTVVLKKMFSPCTCIPFDRSLRDTAIPAFGLWLGFDLEKGGWVQPWGEGVHADVLLRFSSHEANVYKDFRYVMEVSFTNNPFAGAYRLGFDSYSDLKTLHRANSNGNFQVEFSFYSETVPGKGCSNFILDDSSYLVYRTRTKVDSEGHLVSAHYGTIVGGWLFDSKGITFSDGCFNPVANDVNIEDGRYLRDVDTVRRFVMRQR